MVKIQALKNQLPSKYWEAVKNDSKLDEAIDAMALSAIQSAKDDWQQLLIYRNFPSPDLIAFIALGTATLWFALPSWVFGLETFHFWKLPPNLSFQMVMGWSLPYVGLILGFRLLAGRIWYSDAEGLGKLDETSILSGGVIWPLLQATADAVVWRSFLLAIIISFVGGWSPSFWPLDPLYEEETIKASLGSLVPAVPLPRPFYIPVQSAVCGLIATCILNIRWAFVQKFGVKAKSL
eukprot:jgi/Botrbrau1/7731/Bobra.0159s0162.2